MSIAFCSPSIFRKSHESALLDLWRFQSYGDESGLGGVLPPLAIRGLNILVPVTLILNPSLDTQPLPIDLMKMYLRRSAYQK